MWLRAKPSNASKRFFIAATAGIVAVGAAACSRPARELQPAGTAGAVGDVYPHSVEFRTTRLHGRAYSRGSQLCQSCHGIDLKGGSSKISCTQCHAQYPHTENFKRTFEHGAPALAVGGMTQCLRCHDSGPPAEAAAPASAATTCTQCHDFPHPSRWFSAPAHGQAFLKAQAGALTAARAAHGLEGKDSLSEEEQQRVDAHLEKNPVNCMACHGAKSPFKTRHANLAVDCASCHMEMPHPKNFSEGTAHGAAMKENPASCVKCHTAFKRLPGDKQPPPDEQGCYMCHESDQLPKVETTITWGKPGQASLIDHVKRSLSSDPKRQPKKPVKKPRAKAISPATP